MLDLNYETWKTVCKKIFELKNLNCLQLYPFSLLSQQDKNEILSSNFFDNIIKNGFFFYLDENWILPKCYMPKSDGNFRNATLISPLFYLFFQCFTKEISSIIELDTNDNLEVYYAGNFENNKFDYKKDYDNFYKSINLYNEEFQYCIKTDIKDFFPSININILFDKIESQINKTKINIKNKDLQFYKAFLCFIGKNKFPVVKNCTAPSYLATSVFLNNVDISLCEFLNNCKNIYNYKLVRYVDDLYIFFNLKYATDNIKEYKNLILNKLTSDLNKIGLQLNLKKTKLFQDQKVDQELKRSLYNDFVNGLDFNIEDYYTPEQLINFINEFNQKTELFDIDVEEYENLINKNFYIENIAYSPRDVFNNLVYKENTIVQDSNVIKLLYEIFISNYNLLKLDSNKLMILVLNTKSEKLIKFLLSKIFERYRKKELDIYDLTIILTYLVNRNCKHSELLEIVKNLDYSCYQYIENFCHKSFIKTLKINNSVKLNYLRKIFIHSNDILLFYLYSFYKFELYNGNYLTCFAFYKNFFDRITADIDFVIYYEQHPEYKKPNYKKFYCENILKAFYPNNDELIKTAHKIRNSNPLSHSSSGLLKDEIAKVKIIDNIEQLSNILNNYPIE